MNAPQVPSPQMPSPELPSKWTALWMALRLFMSGWLPGFILKWFYPLATCRERIDFLADGPGPHLYVNEGRLPALAHLRVCCYNRLPFPVWVEDAELEISLGDVRFTGVTLKVRSPVGPCDKIPLPQKDHRLSDSEAERVRKHPGDSADLKITGRAWIETPAGRLEKQLDQVETRAFIYRGTSR